MLTRKCALCGEEIHLTLPYSNQYIYYKSKKKWYHVGCFTTVLTPKMKLEDWIDKTRDTVLTLVSKDDVCQWFMHHYEVCLIPSRVFVKLDSIYNGTFKGLAQPIPPNELMDILKYKDDYIFRQFKTKGIEGVGRIDYALVVAMSSYKAYKQMIVKTKAQEAELDKELKDRMANPNKYKLWGYVPSDKPKEEEFDFEEALG